VKVCAAFEDRLIDYDDLVAEEKAVVDTHLLGCASCREYLTLLREIDSTLAAHAREIHLDLQRYADIRQIVTTAPPIAHVTRLPEWLDFVAAAAICVFAYGFAWQTGVFDYVVSAVHAWN
jgi:anti-sigma factor RsiW